MKLKISSISGLGSCHSFPDALKHYLLLTISSLMRALTKEGNHCWNWPFRVGIVTIHYWLLTQSYCVVPKNLRRQAGAIFTWYPKERRDLKVIHDENDVLTDDEYSIVRGLLRKTKYACLYIPNEHLLDLGC